VNPTFFWTPQYPVLLQIANRGYSIMTAANPVYPGETVVGYADGFGQTDPARSTGYAAPVVPDQYAYVTAPVEAWLKGCLDSDCKLDPATVVYAIAYPGSPAAYQAAFTLPQVTVDAMRQYSLVVRVGGVYASDMALNLAPLGP
jgi:uncharacterized protein (TIGR03437 family)